MVVTIAPPPWGWGDPGFSGGYNGDFGTPAGDVAHEYAATHVDEARIGENPLTAWYDDSFDIAYDLKYLAQEAIRTGQGNSSVLVLPGGGDLTANQLDAALDKIAINSVPSVPLNAVTTPSQIVNPNTATFNITLGYDGLAPYEGAFDTAHMGRHYVIFHELGHAFAQSLTFAVSQGYPPSNQAVEAWANTLGGKLAAVVGYTYPTDAQLGSYNGVLPPNFINGTAGTASADYFIGTINGDNLRGMDGGDTMSAGLGNDFVYGDNGNDTLQGNEGNDLVQGNMGDDVVRGGKGDDNVLGGQGNDFIAGDDGNDFIDPGLGSDTMTGGAGADTFAAATGYGVDYINDFNRAEGDSIRATGTYSAYQSGANVAVDFGGGNVTYLVGVNLSSLTSGWIHA